VPVGPIGGTAADLPARPPGPQLRVYVAVGCAGCVRARELVAQLTRDRPGAGVELVDLDRLPPGYPVPPGLVGTPTYVLDGRVRWLGNPAVDELLAVWDEHADAARHATTWPDRSPRP
jgi:hypothetical protein